MAFARTVRPGESPKPELQPELARFLAATQAIRASAERLTRELAQASTGQLAHSLRGLTERLVSDLLPLLDAEEEVVCSRVASDLGAALRTDHRHMRVLTERLAMLSEDAERSLRRSPKAQPVGRALRETMTILEALERDQRAAFGRLEEDLPAADQEQLAARLRAAVPDARERLMLIVRPPMPPRASSVLRKRPDLNSARALSLAEIERAAPPEGHPSELGPTGP